MSRNADRHEDGGSVGTTTRRVPNRNNNEPQQALSRMTPPPSWRRGKGQSSTRSGRLSTAFRNPPARGKGHSSHASYSGHQYGKGKGKGGGRGKGASHRANRGGKAGVFLSNPIPAGFWPKCCRSAREKPASKAACSAPWSFASSRCSSLHDVREGKTHCIYLLKKRFEVLAT